MKCKFCGNEVTGNKCSVCGTLVDRTGRDDNPEKVDPMYQSITPDYNEYSNYKPSIDNSDDYFERMRANNRKDLRIIYEFVFFVLFLLVVTIFSGVTNRQNSQSESESYTDLNNTSVETGVNAENGTILDNTANTYAYSDTETVTETNDLNMREMHPGDLIGFVYNGGDANLNLVSCDLDYKEEKQPKEGYTFVKFEFRVEYFGNDSFHISEYDFRPEVDGVPFEVCDGFQDCLNVDVTDGEEETGSVYLEVPEGAKNISLYYNDPEGYTGGTIFEPDNK